MKRDINSALNIVYF